MAQLASPVAHRKTIRARFIVRLAIALTLLTPLTLAASCSSGTNKETSKSSAANQESDAPSGSGAQAKDSNTAFEPDIKAKLDSGPVPEVEGPIDGSPFLASSVDLNGAGYTEEEFFLSGTAQSFKQAKPFGTDGVWNAEKDAQAPYTTRVVVRRPKHAEDFNGIVVVEWLNVSGQIDAAPNFGYAHNEMLRGYAYVGVSAQKVGIEAEPMGLKNVDGTRYSKLNHPGDAYSYDIFTQAARATVGSSMLPKDFSTRAVFADGESQSAMRLVTYYNAIQPLYRLFDGFIIHSRFDFSTPLSEADSPAIPNGAYLRTDNTAPAIALLSETDVMNTPVARKQPDNQKLRIWEMAGTSHADKFMLDSVQPGLADSDTPVMGFGGCDLPINSANHFLVTDTMLRSLKLWVLDSQDPPNSLKLETDASGQIIRDANGNAKGGIRLPDVEVPVAELRGDGNAPGWCSLFGVTNAFDSAKLQQLYGDLASYRSAFDQALAAAIDAGFILKDDMDLAKISTESVSF